MADAYIGEIRIFSGNYAPRGWALCNGQLISIPANTALFSILGTKFGGDGKTNFALPNLMGKTPLHYGEGTGLTQKDFAKDGGEYVETLLTTQIPAHTHLPNNQVSPNSNSPANAVWSNTDARIGKNTYINSSTNTTMNPLAIQASGGSQPHNNMQPYLGLNFIIALEGGYPIKG